MCAMWILPTLISLPKSFEPNVEFRPGAGKETGYICYPVQILDNISIHNWEGNATERMVLFTETQFQLNIATDIIIAVLIIVCGLISWHSFKMELTNNRERLEHNQLMLFRYNLVAKLKERNLNLSVIIICTSYIFLRLPLIFLGWHLEVKDSNVLIGIFTMLYNLQFVLHFVIYVVVQHDYRNAYCDLLARVFPCIKNCRGSHNRGETVPLK